MSDIDQDPNRVAIAFIEYYYNLVHSGTENLYQVYAKGATLRHADFRDPVGGEAIGVEGGEQIREYWGRSALAGAKVMIQTIEATKSFQESILIVCVGELVPGPVHDTEPVAFRFSHTFLLVPTVKRSVYDVYSDVLAFVPDVDAVYEEPEPETVESPESVEKEVFSVESKDTTPETGLGDEDEYESSKPMSWADQIAFAAAKAKADKPEKKVKEKKEEKKEETKEEIKEEPKKHKSQMVNKKGQVVYPIYVKGVTGSISEEELQQKLEQSFGHVDLCKIDRMIALVNFTEQGSQKKAIKTGTISVKGVDIKLEPRAKKDLAPAATKKKKKAKNGPNGPNGSNGSSDDGFRKVGK
ncbi:hypothetical protein OGAPHI_001201 [Ogataea philodendri]|uniref:NTF2 domain-containing protein n=1 Tax=Ogataea philodendri TaxID=1378263 RepID=A0A9P8TA34_9ASCO|nr:uncharacterized protein OGAPHI_001201 [Ogataea philodendri]KAH3670686.1 hypothetical protein OGAPHI_001201 [Ogataea philodendri]